MDNQFLNFIVIDNDDLSVTLIDKYLTELHIPHKMHKLHNFDSAFIENFASSHNFIFVNITKENENILSNISALSSNDKNIFFMMSSEADTDLFVKSVRFGVKEFISKPIEKDKFISALKNHYKSDMISGNAVKKKVSKLITVTSLEEGCGKTFFTINVARELAEQTKDRVLLIDFNDNLNNVTFNLDIDQMYDPYYFIQNVTNENAKQEFSKLYRYNNTSMYVMSNCMYRAKSSGKLVNDNLSDFIRIAKRFFRFIVVDINNKLDRVNDVIFANTNIFFYIISPGIKANEKNQSYLDSNYNKEIGRSKNVKIILNKYRAKDEQRIAEIESLLGRQIFYKIPMNLSVTTGSTSMGRTIREINPNLDILKNYDSIAKYIINKV